MSLTYAMISASPEQHFIDTSGQTVNCEIMQGVFSKSTQKLRQSQTSGRKSYVAFCTFAGMDRGVCEIVGPNRGHLG
jgi:hypothetical protein